jgi:hypothetical protein
MGFQASGGDGPRNTFLGQMAKSRTPQPTAARPNTGSNKLIKAPPAREGEEKSFGSNRFLKSVGDGEGGRVGGLAQALRQRVGG